MERGEALGPPAGQWECETEVARVFLRPGGGERPDEMSRDEGSSNELYGTYVWFNARIAADYCRDDGC